MFQPVRPGEGVAGAAGADRVHRQLVEVPAHDLAGVALLLAEPKRHSVILDEVRQPPAGDNRHARQVGRVIEAMGDAVDVAVARVWHPGAALDPQPPHSRPCRSSASWARIAASSPALSTALDSRGTTPGGISVVPPTTAYCQPRRQTPPIPSAMIAGHGWSKSISFGSSPPHVRIRP